jgi:hypothetical protein
MSILSQKQEIFGNIAAFRTLTEGLPSLRNTSSFSSINNDGNSISFLCDLIRSLVGYDALQETVVNTLVFALSDIEKEIKTALKVELKSIVSCGVNPSLPSFIKSTGTGIKIQVPKVDFTNQMLIDPRSSAGKLLYNDLTTNLIDSSDFNTFLYQTIQSDPTIQSWGHTTLGQDIFTIQFKATDVSGIDPNNTLTIKAHPTFDNKTLTELNNNFIDSISLFNAENVLNNIVDMVFGTISVTVNKSTSQLINEAQINAVIDRINNSDNNDVIDDSYFKFTNDEKLQQEIEAKARKAGQKQLTTSTELISTVPFSVLSASSGSIAAATNTHDKKIAVSNSINLMGNQIASSTTNETDKVSIKLNFIQQIINNIIKAIVSIIISAKVIMIFLVNYKIIYGQTATYDNPVDFLQKNKNLIHNITKRVGTLITKALLTLALKRIAQLVADATLVQETDKIKSNLAQLLSLFGVPQDTLRIISGLA